jgi:hypothetical protein
MTSQRLLVLGLVSVMALSAFLAPAPRGRAAERGTVVEPFNGKDLAGWKVKGDPKQSKWTVGEAAVNPDDPREVLARPGGRDMVNVLKFDKQGKGHERSLDIYSEQKFGDAIIDVEVLVPKGSNSGIYVMGEYEIQVLDSYGKEKVGPGDMGGIYGAAAPRVNACKAPGQWQQYVIEYRAPRFDADGKKTVNGRLIKVVLNGQVIHQDVELPKQTPGGVTGKEHPEGPVMFQGNHGPIAYRNLKIRLTGK